jgi:hypothetical protein
VKVTRIMLLAFMCIVLACSTGEKERTHNTVPVISLAEILPVQPRLGSRINLRIRASDDDGDRLTYAVNWFRNDRVIGSGLEFYLAEVEKGDRIYADVTPSDGKQFGETVRTTTIIVANSQPKIIGVKLEPEAIVSSTGEIHIIAEGIDPDADSLSYFCYWHVNDDDRLPDSSTTLSLQELELIKGMVVTSQLYAHDGDTVSSPYVLEIEIANSPPMLSAERESIPYSPDSIVYVLPIVDPDGDNVRYELVEAPPGLRIDQTFGIVHGSVVETEPFEILVRATDTEGAFLNARFTIAPPVLPVPETRQ